MALPNFDIMSHQVPIASFWHMSAASIATLATTIIVSIYLWFTYSTRPDHREPPYIRPWIPFIGHMIGMIRYGARYFKVVNKSTKYPIFTLPMLSSRSYIVADATLAGHVQRNGKTLSFYALIVEVTRRLIAFDKDAARISMYNMEGEHGPGGLMAVVHEMMGRLLGPGPNLDAITATQMEKLGDVLNSQFPLSSSGIIAPLYAWQRHIFSVCNAHAIYGPENIFATHPHLEQAFWDFEDGMLGLVIDIYPSITARKAHLARRRVLDGLIEYVKSSRYKKACTLIQERVQTNLSFGLSEDMAGHAELILMFGILGNAVPSNFWLVANIFSRPELLLRIRNEVRNALLFSEHDTSTDQPREVYVSAKRINMKSCPLLYSCYRETLRDISLLTSARMVMENTLLPDTTSGGHFLLKKGSVVQIAGGVIHQDPSIWGEDADGFNLERFITPPETSEPGHHQTAAPLPRNVPSAAFRAYGGGTVLCPGRHFAQYELMTFSAVLAVGFDILGHDDNTLQLPAKDETRIPLSVMKPVYDPLVSIRRRPGWEKVSWRIGL